MPGAPPTPPDAKARISALTDHGRTLLVEAGAGSGKTALMASRVAFLVAAGVPPGNIVAITFTEAAAAELRERIEKFVRALASGEIPTELRIAVPDGLLQSQNLCLQSARESLDEITCTTIHGFCQQLIRPYPVETGLDPGAAIIDPATAELAYQDLLHKWLSERFEGTGSGSVIPSASATPANTGGSDPFATLLSHDPDRALRLLRDVAALVKRYPTALGPEDTGDYGVFDQFADAVGSFDDWYTTCGVVEEVTAETIDDLTQLVQTEFGGHPATQSDSIALLFHRRPRACKTKSTEFGAWRVKTKWRDAAKAAGLPPSAGDDLFEESAAHYETCASAYGAVVGDISQRAVARLIGEFETLRHRYQAYKRDAALLDFDDLLYKARDLLKSNEEVRKALANRYPCILVDEFQDTDPLQAEILWRLAGDGKPEDRWDNFRIRPGALFLVGDPKQAIYRFRGADVRIYQQAKEALTRADKKGVLQITANFRTCAPILEYVNQKFGPQFAGTLGQPDFAPLQATRQASGGPHVAALDISLDETPRGRSGGLIADEVRRAEANTVAETVLGLIGSHPVWDKEIQAYRPARAGDIALLAPVGTSLWIYEHALETRGVPIATLAGKGFFGRQEVQDCIAIARVIADARDTLALGSLIRGPLVGLTDEQIADEIHALSDQSYDRLDLWTPLQSLGNPVLRDALEKLQTLGMKARRTTPYLLMTEAVEALHVRAILQARHPRGAERALANIELLLEMARAYEGRGIAEFASALRKHWNESEAQTEGRPDSQSDAVSIITMHSAKGLEWSVVIPINATISPSRATNHLYRRQDDSLHFEIFGTSGTDFVELKQAEKEELERERLRLWYVALTRARDTLLLPRHSEVSDDDWLNRLDPDLDTLPSLPGSHQDGESPNMPSPDRPQENNAQDEQTWQREEQLISAQYRTITWHSPSRHEAPAMETAPSEGELMVAGNADAATEADVNDVKVQGGMLRGDILHKLMEEVLNGETPDDGAPLQIRASELIAELGEEDHKDPAAGLASAELAATIRRGLEVPAVAALRSRLIAEFPVYGSAIGTGEMALTVGIVDAIVLDSSGRPELVIDWKSDVEPSKQRIREYRQQVSDYLVLTGAEKGFIVFLTSGSIVEVEPP